MAFPSSPTNGQIYSQGGTQYVYNSTYGVWDVNVTTVNADTLDSVNSTQFLRSDTSGTLSGNLSVTGSTTAASFTGIISGSGDGQSNAPYRLSVDYNSYLVAAAGTTWGVFWAGNSGARYGTNGNGGPGNIWSNSGNPNEVVVVGNDLTAWTCYGNTGDTWQRGSFIAAGNITAGGDVITNSDERLKTNVRPIENALDIVCSLEGKLYTKDGKDDQLGMLAQQVEKHLPQLVHTANDEMGTKSVNYQNMVALLVESIKELRAEVAELKGKLNGV